ncbi:phosphate ABC transporter permease subunit PstC [Megalodesulfovibrio paquesii]
MIPAYVILLLLLALSAAAYTFGRNRAFAVAGGPKGLPSLHSRPAYYGAFAALWCFVPAILLFGVWQFSESRILTGLVTSHLPAEVQALPADQLGLVINDVKNLVSGNILSGEPSPEIRKAAEEFIRLRMYSRVCLLSLCLVLALGGMGLARRSVTPQLRARNQVERLVKWLLIACSLLAIVTTVGIILSVLFEAIRFFKIIPLGEFLFGLDWSPQMAIRADQVGGSGSFGAIPVFVGTALISLISMLVAVPIGLMAAIYMSEYASRKFRAVAKPLMEILAGIPTVVYGFFAALVVAPFIRDMGATVGLSVSSESALAAGLVMGIMIIPFVSSLSDDVINAVPQSLRDGALALGSTPSETVKRVVLPAALPGIVGSVLLAMSRAIGETMIVVMAAGLSANLTVNPFETVTTVTVQIVTLLIGDQEFDSPKTLAAFALGLVLFLVTLCLNIFALHVVRKYREQYE